MLADVRTGKCRERLRSALLLERRWEMYSAVVKSIVNPVVFQLAGEDYLWL
jgi:hypothetical protein